MIDTALALLAPHYCSGCGKIGTVLCDNCKYDIVTEQITICIVCKKPAGIRGICAICHPSYDQAWTLGKREDTLEAVINLYKFERVKAAYRPLADMLNSALPVLPLETRILAIPTVPSHIRERGYDHSLLLARQFARLRGLALSKALRRASSTTQRGASMITRKQQAAQAFTVSGNLDRDIPYLLIDDIVTTGATLEYAARALKAAGATKVWVATIAYQTLD